MIDSINALAAFVSAVVLGIMIVTLTHRCAGKWRELSDKIDRDVAELRRSLE